MYTYPVLFPESSNREDLNRTLSIFDDDTGDPLNLTGIVSLANQNGFTGSNWQITDGLITTTSATPITVPGYPVGNQLLAIGMVVGAGLNILQGDVVTITDVGGQATLSGYVMSYTSGNGSLVVQVGLMFQLEIRSQDRHGRSFGDFDYSQWYDWGGGPVGTPLLIATLGQGLTVVDLGYLQINIPEAYMRRLTNKSYLISLVCSDSVNTRQLFVGKLPMIFGGVNAIYTPSSSVTQGTPPSPYSPVTP